MDNYLVNYLAYPENQTMAINERLETMYPESYTKIYPHVQDVVDTISDEDMAVLTPGDITFLADQAVNLSSGGAVATAKNAGVIGDLAQILLLRELYDRYDDRRYPPYYVPYYQPFFRPRHRGRFGRY